jgi:nitrogen fixation protein NifM
MSSRVQQQKPKQAPEYAYPLMRIALERFQKPVSELSKKEYQHALKQAQKMQAMENAVLKSPEAANVVVSSEQLNAGVKQIEERFPDKSSFLSVLRDNQLDEESLSNALYRELMFDAVMNKVSANAATVSDLDVQIYYHMHPEKFNSPETRKAHHILITVNPDFPDNTHNAAWSRIEAVLEELKAKPESFAELATRHSECPSALHGGELGYAKAGQLYPQLDEVIFQMAEGEFSEVLESEAGFHIVHCSEIKPAHHITLEMAQDKIRSFLEERQRNICQKAWLDKLMENKNG